jgi:hypothetical protein
MKLYISSLNTKHFIRSFTCFVWYLSQFYEVDSTIVSQRRKQRWNPKLHRQNWNSSQMSVPKWALSESPHSSLHSMWDTTHNTLKMGLYLAHIYPIVISYQFSVSGFILVKCTIKFVLLEFWKFLLAKFSLEICSMYMKEESQIFPLIVFTVNLLSLSVFRGECNDYLKSQF